MEHRLPLLPYPPEALAPHINAYSLRLHYGKHHAGYVRELNLVLQRCPAFVQEQTPEWLLEHLQQIPAPLRDIVAHNAGGHINHSWYWRSMAPACGDAPTATLAAAIDLAFGSFSLFQSQFEEAGNTIFGVGWVWLVQASNSDRPLEILTSSGHGSPPTMGFDVILCCDVWEHAYYLQYENRRADYLHEWWNVVNWKDASLRYSEAKARSTPDAHDASRNRTLKKMKTQQRHVF